ncbi:conserved hypothetical protein [metagenome]|uniref:Uncharacterized protein n=1 Tax=metagenome TaxID=256318 RepID=A0A2P2CE99_9ZZZZ
MSGAATADDRAWGWVDHLVAGGTTPWADWAEAGPPRDRQLPGAQHLEVLRRLNLVRPASPGLAGTVLSTSGAGRGQQDLDLVGVRERAAFGARPVDPAEVSVEELCRIAAGALADLVLAAPSLPAQDPVRTPRPRLRRTRYRLVGDPLLGAAYRRQLVAQGRPPGGRSPRVLLLLTDYASYLADVWSSQARRGNGLGWAGWLDQFVGQSVVPPRVDVLALAELWGRRVGVRRVHPVFGAAEVAKIAGGDVRAPHRLSWAALEAVRETSTALRVAVPEPERRSRIAETLLPWLRAVDDGTLAAPVVPERHHDWVRAEAVRVRDGLLAAGYPVPEGGLDRLLPDLTAPRGEPGDPMNDEQDDGKVLGVMMKALHRGATR